MKKYHQIENKSGKVIDVFIRPDENERHLPHQELYTDEYDQLKIGESVRFTGQTKLIRVE